MKKNSKNKENVWVISGSVIAFLGISIPFIIIYIAGWDFNKQFENLAGVGDFFGGTTVGLLSLAGILFVAAAIVMQKEELSLQRLEIEQTRAEYKITNKTLKKQQFETTFFNMINLHHNLLNDITIVDGKYNTKITIGRASFNELYNDLKKIYYNEIWLEYKNDIINDKAYTMEEYNEFVLELILDFERSLLLQKARDNIYPNLNEDFDFIDDTIYEEFEQSVYDETNEKWIKIKDDLLDEYNKDIKGNRDNQLSIIEQRFSKNLENLKSRIGREFEVNFRGEPLVKLKKLACEKLFITYENEISNYFRNIYIIVKFIESSYLDEIEKNNYRGILIAQISSMELMLIFYNIVYTDKGRKFKELIKNTNFFDDHLVESKFIWSNDQLELESL